MFNRNNYKQIADMFPLLKNPKKYVGNLPICTRSSWESHYVRWCDTHPSILEWSSESIVIPYKYDVDGKKHRYFPDFYIKFKNKEGLIEEIIIEIKPFDQLSMPKKPKRITKQYKIKVAEFVKNQNKWKSAERYCELLQEKGKNIKFMVLTEKELFGK